MNMNRQTVKGQVFYTIYFKTQSALCEILDACSLSKKKKQNSVTAIKFADD